MTDFFPDYLYSYCQRQQEKVDKSIPSIKEEIIDTLSEQERDLKKKITENKNYTQEEYHRLFHRLETIQKDMAKFNE